MSSPVAAPPAQGTVVTVNVKAEPVVQKSRGAGKNAKNEAGCHPKCAAINKLDERIESYFKDIKQSTLESTHFTPVKQAKAQAVSFARLIQGLNERITSLTQVQGETGAMSVYKKH